MDKKVFVDINNAHGEAYTAYLQQLLDRGIDPFSLESMLETQPELMLKIGKYWFVTNNKFPYAKTRTHLLFITVEYAESFSDIPSEAFAELAALQEEFIKQYSIKGGCVCMRFGDTSQTGATVKHLHAQLIEAEEGAGGVEFPIGRKKR
jgi:diadenosine tetraphosphate (Ap4A) HIT family hydrolase